MPDSCEPVDSHQTAEIKMN